MPKRVRKSDEQALLRNKPLTESARHIARSPDTIITTLFIQIVFMLLFVYVFGGTGRTRT